MRISIITFILLTFLTSCSEKAAPPKEQPKAESTGEIVNKYVDTLVTAQDKAKKAAGAADARTAEESEAAQEIDKQ